MSISDVSKTRAEAVITVHTYQPASYETPADGPSLTRIHVEEAFTGDIEGAGVVEFLQAARADGSASFVGIERVTGAVAGDWFVVPGSGTGELAGLRGEGGFRANLGENADVHLDYWFD